jgi:phage shock protein A
METTSETLLTADADETAALDLLETKIIAIVDQLKEARILRERVEARAAELEGKISELEESVSQLRSQNSATDKVQKSVRSRVESLLNRIESIG